MYAVNQAVTRACRCRLLLTMNSHNNRTSSDDDEHHRRDSAAAAAVDTCTRIGDDSQRRRLNATDEMNRDSLTSSVHLHAGQYYRWNPDISDIAVSRSSVTATTASYKIDVRAPADSAASSPWQQTAADSSTTSHNAMTLRIKQPVSCFDNV